MEKYNDSYYKNILAKLLRISLINSEPAKELIDQMFDDNDFKEQAICLCKTYMMSDYRKSTLIAKSIDVRALTALTKICRREKMGIIPMDFTEDEDKTYRVGDKISILILSLQEKEFEKAALEAYGVSGAITEIERKYTNSFTKKLSKENPMVEIQDVDENTYNLMKQQMKKLPYPLQFTLFPEKNEKGNINVGFFSYTYPTLINNGRRIKKEGPYNITKIASVLLACALLEDPYYDEENKNNEKKNKEYLKEMMALYYGADEPFYIVPTTVGKDGQLNVFMDKAKYIDITDIKTMSYLDYGQYIQQHTGMNRILIPMTEKEYEQYKTEIVINPKTLMFCNEKIEPTYVSPERIGNIYVAERLIDVLNRKREQVLLMSDDFNGKNLMNLENYIAGTVQELIMREDEDYTDWIEKDEILDSKEMELLSNLENSYHLSYVYEEHDKVLELINAEREALESFRSKSDGELER